MVIEKEKRDLNFSTVIARFAKVFPEKSMVDLKSYLGEVYQNIENIIRDLSHNELEILLIGDIGEFMANCYKSDESDVEVTKNAQGYLYSKIIEWLLLGSETSQGLIKFLNDKGKPLDGYGYLLIDENSEDEEVYLNQFDRYLPPEVLKDKYIIEGAKPIVGEVDIQGAKNLALAVIVAPILSQETVTLRNLPNIDDIKVNLSIMESLGAQIERIGDHDVHITCKDIKAQDIDPELAARTTASKYFIPLLVQRFGEITTGASGGDYIGGMDREYFDQKILRLYKNMGVGCDGLDEGKYRFFREDVLDSKIVLKQRAFGITMQTLFAKSFDKTGQKFTIINPAIEPEILSTIDLLNSMGAEIEYDENGKEAGQDRIIIKPQSMAGGADFRITSDPNAIVSYTAMALITNGDVKIKQIDYTEKIEAILKILKGMNVDFDYNQDDRETYNLHIKPSMDRLKPVDLETDFWPAQCHTDWQQLLTPVLARLGGQSLIDENVYPRRFTLTDILNRMSIGLGGLQLVTEPERIKHPDYKTDNQPHTLKIVGPMNFNPIDVKAPSDIRGATGLLTTLMSIDGISILRDVKQLDRGLEALSKRLRTMGASLIDAEACEAN